MDAGTHYLVGELERLLSLPIGSKQELAAWYAESKKLQQELRRELPARFPDLAYPDEIWHFLADAEIRARDAGYRQYQEDIIKDYIKKARGETRVA